VKALNSSPTDPSNSQKQRKLLITAGPTHEPIDAVRFLGNRSSGRVGISLANEAAQRGWNVRLLLGPVSLAPADSRVTVRRFRSCSDLEALLADEASQADVIVMAAAVADYRPKPNPAMSGGKFRRTSGPMTLELESTPDLLAGVAARRRPGQLLIGFALEPRDELMASSRAKLEKKKVDLVVGNPLETMDSETIEAIVIGTNGFERRTEGKITKTEFAAWLMGIVETL
jgi:phosphopantothenoylcysteine decarboxylase/phosphopantothenate--cysteine ligase